MLYAIGQRKSSLTLADLDVDSPFNTRKFPGPTPHPHRRARAGVAAGRP